MIEYFLNEMCSGFDKKKINVYYQLHLNINMLAFFVTITSVISLQLQKVEKRGHSIILFVELLFQSLIMLQNTKCAELAD